jgi:hypothetical protein
LFKKALEYDGGVAGVGNPRRGGSGRPASRGWSEGGDFPLRILFLFTGLAGFAVFCLCILRRVHGPP